MKDALQAKDGLFGGDQVVSNRITESRKKDGIIRSAILMPVTSKLKSKSRKKSKTKTGAKGASSKDGEAGKAGAAKKSKKTKAAKVKSKKAKANSAGESGTTDVLSNLPFVSLGEKVSEIRRQYSWPSTFPLLSAVEAVAMVGFKPEYISSALDAPIGGRLHHAIDSYRVVTDDARVLGILKRGYKIPFKYRSPIQKRSQKTPLPATSAARQVLDDEVQGLISKKAVKVVKPMSDSMLVHTLPYLNLYDPLTNGDPLSI